LIFHATPVSCSLEVQLPSDDAAKQVFFEFDSRLDESRLTTQDLRRGIRRDVTIFIAHGRDAQWRELKDHLTDKQQFRHVSAYETGERAGLTVIEILKGLLDSASFAVLVHTAEDMEASGARHARLNVVHETGLFQGRLGFARAVVLLENGCDDFTNIAGLHQIRFAHGNIASTFGNVLAAIDREFGAFEE
jgi:predicted nucleotide-binding protein